jgi:nicotinamidase-related amidase
VEKDMDFSDIIPEEDLQAYRKGKHGQLMGFGKSPCLMVVDMTYAFVDPSFPLTSGNLGWQAVKNIKPLLEKARGKNVPVIYIKGHDATDNPADWGISRKRQVLKELKRGKGNEIVEEIAPRQGEIVIQKLKASAFFATNLLGTLIYHHIDTLIVTGASTSGCVRATVVDAASYNYYVVIPEECVADRAQVPHKVNLFDMHMKYADVIPLSGVLQYLQTLS